ncbi:hypothetical protein BIW11_10842, partial [Tropilaelaps mercedesae]
ALAYPDHDLHFAASSMNQSPYNQYQVLVLLFQDAHSQQQAAAAPNTSVRPPYSILSTYPYPTAPKTRSPANDWHSFVFGTHQSATPYAPRTTAAFSHEDIPSGNALDILVGSGPSVAMHPVYGRSVIQPPKPSFPAHLNTIQNQHPHGADYWKGLQGDHTECPSIPSCPARYGCYIQQKPGSRCSYCKCNPRPPHNAGERK